MYSKNLVALQWILVPYKVGSRKTSFGPELRVVWRPLNSSFIRKLTAA